MSTISLSSDRRVLTSVLEFHYDEGYGTPITDRSLELCSVSNTSAGLHLHCRTQTEQ